MTAIEALYRKHERELLVRAARLVGDDASAEDMVQDTFCEAMQSWQREPIRNPRAWLYRLLRDNCYDHLKRHAGREIAWTTIFGEGG